MLRIPPLVHLCQICIYLKGYQTTQPADNSDRDKSARKRGLVGPYVKTTRTINKIDRNHKDSLTSVNSIRKCKKKSLYNQPKPYFFQKIIVKSFLPVEAEITVTKVFITANMKNSKSYCKQEVDVR